MCLLGLLWDDLKASYASVYTTSKRSTAAPPITIEGVAPIFTAYILLLLLQAALCLV